MAEGFTPGNIAGISFLHKHINALVNKKLVVFAVGATGYDRDNITSLRMRNLRDLDIPLFYLQGALDMDKLSFLDRTLCKVIRRIIAKKAPYDREAWENALLQMKSGCDWTDKAQLEPIIRYVKNIDSKKGSSYN